MCEIVEVRCSSLSSCMGNIIGLIIREGMVVLRECGGCMHNFWDRSYLIARVD